MEKDRKVQGENGAVVVLFLVLFFVMALFFFAMYQLILTDYNQSAHAIEGKSEGLKQNNLVESAIQDYKYDMLNDVMYDANNDLLGDTEEWKADYRNYTYDFQKVDENNQVETAPGYFGNHTYVKFKNYEVSEEVEETTDTPATSTTTPPSTDASTAEDTETAESPTQSRIYPVKTNWIKTIKDTSDFFDGNALATRNALYIKMDFASSVNMVTLTYGNSDHTIEKTVTLRKGSKKGNIFKLPLIENTTNPSKKPNVMYIEQFTLSSDDGELQNTSFSILKARDVDIMVYEENPLEKKKTLKTQKTVRIEQGKLQNRIHFIDNEVLTPATPAKIKEKGDGE